MKQKSENQKALPKFFKLLAVAGLIGGVLGSLSCVAGYFWQEHDLGAAFARMLHKLFPARRETEECLVLVCPEADASGHLFVSAHIKKYNRIRGNLS